MARGLFLCIEGGDGSGKTTEHAMLAKQLRSAGYTVETVDFPQYGQPSAELVTAYLNNEFGPATELDPRLASVLFAIDRLAAKDHIQAALDQGAFVLANRFTASNMAHQAAKIQDEAKQVEFFRWVHQFEHGVLGIPEPDHHFLLHLPAATALQRIKNRASRSGSGKSLDGHETDLDYQVRAEKRYLGLAATFPEKFTVIECVDDTHEKTPQEINSEIWEYVAQLVKK
ncbi:dTMP kinase [Candidatus Saccharibacteria bacterium]|nr:MAG: dTMP kinase [Candidatus Saccharibacteria bacterium]